MGPKDVNGMTVFLCSNCGHFVMNQEAFNKLVNLQVEEHTHEVPEEESVHCPGCNGAMPKAEIGDGGVDVCHHCHMVHTDRDAMEYIATNENEDKTILGFVFKLDEARNIHNAQHIRAMTNTLVNSAFVLYKNGLLLTSYSVNTNEDMDHDIMGGMIMAITDFVQISFKDFCQDSCLESITFKGKEIAFTHGDYIIVAIQVDGKLDDETRAKLDSKLKEIEANNKDYLHSWSGDVTELGSTIEEFSSILLPLKG